MMDKYCKVVGELRFDVTCEMQDHAIKIRVRDSIARAIADNIEKIPNKIAQYRNNATMEVVIRTEVCIIGESEYERLLERDRALSQIEAQIMAIKPCE